MGIGKDRRALYDELVDQADVELTRSMGRMFSGTSRMLSSLSDCATMAILTNGSQRYCEACIETFALSPYIALTAGFRQRRDESTAHPPVAARIERGCRDRRGRRATDIQNARAAGAYAVGVTYGMGSREELSGADALCDSPQEVADCCRRLIDAH